MRLWSQKTNWAPDLEMDPPAVSKKVVPDMNRVLRNKYMHGLEGEEQSMSSMADLTFGERVEIQRAKMLGMLWVNRREGEAEATTEEAGAAIVEKEGVTVSESSVMARKRGRLPKKGPEATDMAVTSEKAATSEEAAASEKTATSGEAATSGDAATSGEAAATVAVGTLEGVGVVEEGVTVSEAPVMARKRGKPLKKGPEAMDLAATSEEAATL
ncbi:hypothetical protein DFP73DRAFT_600610 [Morchella snyderi]|nr:hypothetical protein DFP73DRAFT_600610 [Morchella snyderi]